MTEIRQATINDAPAIQALAEATWWPTYGNILSEDQLRYMLNNFYSLDNITTQISTGEQTYILLLEDGIAVGFAAYATRPENTQVYKLHKLYCLIETKGKGYGKLLVAEVEKAVKAAGKTILELNVNKYNEAIGFYTNIGFTIAYEEDIPIGQGYFMNDYVMRKDL